MHRFPLSPARVLRTLLGLSALALLASSCGPPWTVIKKSQPPAFAGVQAVTVEYDWSELMVGKYKLEDYLAKQNDEKKANFETIRTQVSEHFVQAFDGNTPSVQVTAGAAGDGGHLKVSYQRMVQGKYAVMYAQPSFLSAKLTWSKGGEVTDEIVVTSQVPATITTPAIVQRLNRCGTILGQSAARFIDRSNKGK